MRAIIRIGKEANIKKESPNEGTETTKFPLILGNIRRNKKRIPE